MNFFKKKNNEAEKPMVQNTPSNHIPEFLKEFEQDLMKYKMDFIRIKATPLSQEKTLPFTQSKFGGKPYVPVGMEYPKDASGKPLVLWAQLNFSEIPSLENYPEKGILQFFVSADGWYDMEEYKVIYHEHIDEKPQTDFSFLTPDLYRESPIDGEHSLTFSKQTEYGNSTDFRFDCLLNGKDFWEFYYEHLTKPQQKECNIFMNHDTEAGHKIGGYCYFTQYDFRDANSNYKDFIPVLQIDTDDKITFGDSGVALFLLDKNDLINKKFDKTVFYWDCM